MRGSAKKGNDMFIIIMSAVFLTCFMILVTIGALSYRNAVRGQFENNDTRALRSYLTTVVRAGDKTDCILVERDGDRDVLIVRTEGTEYARKIYLFEGMLVEEYAKEDQALSPEEATEIGETSVFTAELTDGILRIRTDAGTVIVTLRSTEGIEE